MILKSFEIQTFQGGRWKISSIFDDFELAVFDARRMSESKRFAGVRVVYEEFNDHTGETKSRTVFKAAVSDDHNAKAIKSQTSVQKNAMADRKQRTIKKTARRKQTKKIAKQKQTQNDLLKHLLLLTALVLGGIATLVGLQYLQEFL